MNTIIKSVIKPETIKGIYFMGWLKVFRANWNKKWTFEKKMNITVFITVSMTMLLAMLISTISSIYAQIRQSSMSAEDHLSILAASYENNINQYRNLIKSTIMNEHVQAYGKSRNTVEMIKNNWKVYMVLRDMMNIQNDINFMTVINRNMENYVYCGNFAVSQSRFDRSFENDFKNSIPAIKNGTLRMNFSNNYSTQNHYSLSLYFPIYSVTSVGKQNGYVLANINYNEQLNLENTTLYKNPSLYLVDTSGKIMASKDANVLGQHIDISDRLAGEKGSFIAHGDYVIYQSVGKWNLYLVNKFPISDLARYSIITVIIMLLVLINLIVLSLLFTRRNVKKLFKPFNKIVNKMNEVSNGKLDIRIDTNDMNCDFLTMADGFNLMMDKIDLLMKKVQKEQEAVNQMRLNALHSQIKPHFLYNTLECIHWQAVSDGNKDISIMVKALAQYYRICLSEGQDVITLGKEMEHVQNYVIIQNMRYDNIITLNINIPEEYKDVSVPKLTFQPLVENSIYHGIRVKEGRKGCVNIYYKKSEDICIVVEDNGKGISDDELKRINQDISCFDLTVGYGINNVNKRIELMCGDKYGLKFCKNITGGLSVEIHLPGMRKENVQNTDCR